MVTQNCFKLKHFGVPDFSLNAFSRFFGYFHHFGIPLALALETKP
jgi:hypothetical protein